MFPRGKCLLVSRLRLCLVARRLAHHGSNTFVSKHSPYPPPPPPRASCTSADNTSPLPSSTRFQHHSLWKTWRGGPTVRSRHAPFPAQPTDRFLVCVLVNASELERLKKRFMKLDRCRTSLYPLPSRPVLRYDPHAWSSLRPFCAFTVMALDQ